MTTSSRALSPSASPGLSSGVGIRLGVALLRVSTDGQFQEGESIEAQRRKVEFLATRECIDIVRFFAEHYSGRAYHREVLEEMFAYLEANPDISYVVIGDIDRFTRGGSDVYLELKRRLGALNIQLRDTSGVIQPERNRLEHLGFEYGWSMESPSRLAEVFLAEKSRVEATDILSRTIGQQIESTQQGYQCRGANFGYENQKIITAAGSKKTIMVPHETESRWIKRMFELRAEGGWSDEAICEAVNALGYASRPQNIYDPKTRKVLGQTKAKQLDVKQLNRYITRTIYAGIKCEKWNRDIPVRAPIEALVSLELFNRANRGKLQILERDDGSFKIEERRLAYKNHKENPAFLLRHVVGCPLCGRAFVASKSRGKSGKQFAYYHCSRGHKYFGVNSAEFEKTVAKGLARLEAKPGFLGLLREIVREVWTHKNRAEADDQKHIRDHIKQLKQRQEALLSALVSSSSATVQKHLEQQVEELDRTIAEAKDKLTPRSLTEDKIEAYFDLVKSLMEHPGAYALKAPNKAKLEKLWRLMFVSNPSYQDLIDGTLDLTLIYRLNRDFKGDKALLAGQLGAQWNTFEAQVQAVFNDYAPEDIGLMLGIEPKSPPAP